ncbi:MAG: ROK family protein [Chloroflexaceae bacterium]|nr:ROK family protein [Chloroflexaceae bacterium]
MEWVIGVDVGGTQIRAILADRAGQIQYHTRVATAPSREPRLMIEQILHCVAQVRAHLPDSASPMGIGIAAPGPLDPYEGVILAAPNMPGWINIPLRAIIAEQTGLTVVLGNDANAAALGEWHFGGGVGKTHLVYITVSTGIGAGVIVDGRLLLGRLGAAGELGHVIISLEQRQVWEQLASGTALGAAAARVMADTPESLLHQYATPQTVTAAHVAMSAAQGDPLCSQLMQRQAELLGIGLVNALHLFSPERILLGGSVITANPFLLTTARQVAHELVLADFYRDVPIEVAQLGEHAGVLGAVALFWYQHKGQA